MQSRTYGLLAVAAAAAAAVAWVVRDVPAALGARPDGDRAERMRRSPHYRDGTFHNSAQTRTLVPAESRSTMRDFLFGGEKRKPSGAVPVVMPAAATPQPTAESLHITWHGHASVLVEIEGRRVLIDPMWSDRCSPSSRVGPHRLHPVPVPLEQLPELDAIIISHDHYDHLDMATVKALTRTQSAPFVVPLGVGAHLDRWGCPNCGSSSWIGRRASRSAGCA